MRSAVLRPATYPAPSLRIFALCCAIGCPLVLCAISREDKLYRFYQTSVCNNHRVLREVMWVQARIVARSIDWMLEYFINTKATLENK